MKVTFFFYITLLALCCGDFDFIKAQSDAKTLAKIGNISLSEKEFIMRYEMTPHIGLHQKKMQDALKEEFLYSIIMEKLYALNAVELKLDTNAIVRYTLHEYEKMFVRDALYKSLIIDKAKSKADSLVSNYIKEASEFRVICVFSKKEEEADRIYNLLNQGILFDSLYVELSKEKNDTLKIRIGDAGEEIESELMKVKEQGFTKPLFLNDNIAYDEGWYIFKILRKNSPVLQKLTGWETEYKRLEKIAEERAEDKIYQNFMRDYFTGKKISANVKLMKSIAEKVSRLLSEKEGAQDSGEKFLNVYDLLRIESQLGKDSLNLPYIILDYKNISLGDFLRHFRFESFSSDKIDFKSVVSLLNAKTRKFIEEEMLADEGYKRGLQNSDEVKKSYNMFKENYLSQVAQANASDSIRASGEGTALGNKNLLKINIVEILTDSLETMEKIISEIEAGKDMHELALKYSKRSRTKSAQGEFGLFSPGEYGEIGRAAAGMEVGEIYGPLKVPEGYSIFKLIEKQADTTTAPGHQRNDVDINDYTVKLAQKFGVKINYELLKSITITSINSMWFRYLGFGGKITAVPLITPNEEWARRWLEQVRVNP